MKTQSASSILNSNYDPHSVTISPTVSTGGITFFQDTLKVCDTMRTRCRFRRGSVNADLDTPFLLKPGELDGIRDEI